MCLAQSTIDRNRSLIAILESATISDALEWTGDELRVIDIAEFPKHLVLLAEVVVDAGVETVSSVFDSRTAQVIPADAADVGLREEIEQLDGVLVEPIRRDDVAWDRVTYPVPAHLASGCRFVNLSARR